MVWLVLCIYILYPSPVNKWVSKLQQHTARLSFFPHLSYVITSIMRSLYTIDTSYIMLWKWPYTPVNKKGCPSQQIKARPWGKPKQPKTQRPSQFDLFIYKERVGNSRVNEFLHKIIKANYKYLEVLILRSFARVKSGRALRSQGENVKGWSGWQM